MKRTLFILISLFFGLSRLSAQENTYRCGDVIEITATAKEGYHFVRWSDGNTENPRTIVLSEAVNLIAEFVPNCGEWADVPVIRLYDWLLMLNKDTLQKQNYEIDDADIRWYRIVGSIDDWYAGNGDDELVGTGYYLTLGKSLVGTGEYYAVIDAGRNRSEGAKCTESMRSEIVSYTSSDGQIPKRIFLQPTSVRRGEVIQVHGLDERVTSDIRIYDAAGRLLQAFESSGKAVYDMPAIGVAGCYFVRVKTDDEEEVLRYIVE